MIEKYFEILGSEYEHTYLKYVPCEEIEWNEIILILSRVNLASVSHGDSWQDVLLYRDIVKETRVMGDSAHKSHFLIFPNILWNAGLFLESQNIEWSAVVLPLQLPLL